MDAFIQYLVSYGDIGMFVSAFLAGSVLPFSSEVVMVGLLAAGAPPDEILVCATAGNTLGSLFNYGVGSLGREEWIARWTKVSPEKLAKGKRWVRHYGAWAGLLAWIPILGSIITVAMGFLRVKLVYAVAAMATGKFVRYWILLGLYRAA